MKYWHLPSWEKVAKPEHSVRWSTPPGDTKSNPAGGAQPHQALAEAIHQLVNPTVGEPPSDPGIIHMAQTLQKHLLSKCSIEEKHRRLQSVVSKMEHNQKLLNKSQEKETTLQEELRSLQEERAGLVKKNEDLEVERQALLKVVHMPEEDHLKKNKLDQEMTSGSEADSESSENGPPAKRSKSQTRRVPRQAEWHVPPTTHLNPAPAQWADDIAGMAPQLLQHLQHLLHAEAQRRAQPGPQPQAPLHPAGEDQIPGFGDLSHTPGAAQG